MTISNCITSSAVSETKSYPTLISNAADNRVAEDTEDYSPEPTPPEYFTKTLKQIELRALQTAGYAHVGRLFTLANLLQESDPGEMTAEQLTDCAEELRKTGSKLESLLSEIVSPLIEDQKLGYTDDPEFE